MRSKSQSKKVAVISLFLKTNVLLSHNFSQRDFIAIKSVIKIKVNQANFMKFLKKIQHNMSKCDKQKLLVF